MIIRMMAQSLELPMQLVLYGLMLIDQSIGESIACVRLAADINFKECILLDFGVSVVTLMTCYRLNKD